VRTSISVKTGGNAFNVASDLVALGFPARDVACAGAIGDDMFGEIFASRLDALGIRSEIYKAADKRTSTIIILRVKGEEPRYYLDEGANVCLDPEFAASRLDAVKPSIFYTGETGHLLSLLPGFAGVLEKAKKIGCLTIVDTVVPPIEDWQFLRDALPFIDVLKLNEYEALSFTHTNNPNNALAALSGSGVPLVIVSLADRGLLSSYEGTRHEVPAFTVPCVDPQGAGDAFAAGMIRKLSSCEGCTLAEKLSDTNGRLFDTILFASACGASAVTRNGCTAGVTARSVRELLSSQGPAVRSRITRI
jgi:sugar/nucleoside kinase (ribokinase family)